MSTTTNKDSVLETYGVLEINGHLSVAAQIFNLFDWRMVDDVILRAIREGQLGRFPRHCAREVGTVYFPNRTRKSADAAAIFQMVAEIDRERPWSMAGDETLLAFQANFPDSHHKHETIALGSREVTDEYNEAHGLSVSSAGGWGVFNPFLGTQRVTPRCDSPTQRLLVARDM